MVVAYSGMEDLKAMPYVRAMLAESLRMYPQPPILIRRSLEPDVLPAGLAGDPNGYPIGKGADIFISVWNLHRSVCAAPLLAPPCTRSAAPKHWPSLPQGPSARMPSSSPGSLLFSFTSLGSAAAPCLIPWAVGSLTAHPPLPLRRKSMPMYPWLSC
jgi:hypothetical protein